MAYFGYPMPNNGAVDAFAELAKDDPAITVTVGGPGARGPVRAPRGRPPAGLGPGLDRGEGRLSEQRFATALLSPGALWLVLLFAIPLGITLALSFGTTDDLGNSIYGWHPENYEQAFDPLFVPVLLRSVGFALATVGLCLAIGYPVAYYIARFGGRYKHALIALVVLPFFVNYLVRTYAWVALWPTRGS